MDARRPLSLRTSSFSPSVLRNRRNSNSFEEDPYPASTTSGSYESPEQMMRRAEIHPDVSFEVRRRESPISPIISLGDKSLSYTRNKDSCSTQSTKRRSNECMDSNGQSPKRRLYDSENYKKNFDRKSSNSGEAVEHSSDTDKNTSKSSSIFDYVASLPNNDDTYESYDTRTMTESLAIRNDTDSDTNERIYDNRVVASDSTNSTNRNSDSNCRASDKASNFDNSRTKENFEESSDVSQRSIVLGTTKNAFPKRPRNKKGPKSMKKRKDQGSQTDSFHSRMSDGEDTFDENLPFGCLMIYDTIHSRIPSKIVFSSLNAKVFDL